MNFPEWELENPEQKSLMGASKNCFWLELTLWNMGVAQIENIELLEVS